MQKPPPIKVADDAWFETRSTLSRRAQGPHAPPAIVGRRLPAGITQGVMPTGKRLLQRRTGDSKPRPPFFGGTQRNTPGCARCQCSKADAVTTFNIFRIVAYGAMKLEPCAPMLSAMSVVQVCRLSASARRGCERGGCDRFAKSRQASVALQGHLGLLQHARVLVLIGLGAQVREVGRQQCATNCA